MPAPYKKVDVRNLKLGVKIAGVTGTPTATFWPVICRISQTLNEETNTVDLNSSCGPDKMLGQEDNSFDVEVLWLEASSYTGEDVITAKELYELYKSKETVEWKLCDDITTPVNYGKAFNGFISSFGDAAEVEGAITASITISISGSPTLLV